MLERILNIIKSTYVNYKVFPKEIAKKRPIYMSYKTKCKGLYKGCIDIKCDTISKSMLLIGLNTITYGLNGGEYTHLMFEDNSKLIIHGVTNFTKGASVCIYKDATLEVGEDFFTNAYCTINTYKSIKIGDRCTFGWNCTLLDSDGHAIWNEDKQRINEDKPITIGNDVWLAAKTTILKGCNIKNGCVVGYGTTVSGSKASIHDNSIIVGNPPREVKTNITWDK